jgi:mono/diheme cytochrome c family protein
MLRPIALTALLLAASASAAFAGPAQDAIIAKYRQQASGDFSVTRGKAFFAATHQGGKPDTPSCTTCHGSNPAEAGKTRAGKEIAPMALSKTPDRYSDPEKVEKWFGRNCESVLGRACTADEKGDFLAFMTGQ